MREKLPPADVPVVILAGGRGMRLQEETERVPKPMVRIGDRPIIWHIMRHYSTYGFRRFVICLGYKGWVVKEFFLNYAEEVSDLRIDLSTGGVKLFNDRMLPDWEVTLADTGLLSGSTGRLTRIRRYIDTPYVMYTYGDGVGDIDLAALHDLHASADDLVTVTGVRPQSRYGVLHNVGNRVVDFTEKPSRQDGFESGGFFCLQTTLLDRLAEHRDDGFFEEDLLPALVDEGCVGIHQHDGYWQSMDTYRDYVGLNRIWDTGKAPWQTWT